MGNSIEQKPGRLTSNSWISHDPRWGYQPLRISDFNGKSLCLTCESDHPFYQIFASPIPWKKEGVWYERGTGLNKIVFWNFLDIPPWVQINCPESLIHEICAFTTYKVMRSLGTWSATGGFFQVYNPRARDHRQDAVSKRYVKGPLMTFRAWSQRWLQGYKVLQRSALLTSKKCEFYGNWIDYSLYRVYYSQSDYISIYKPICS